jgi:hypothetical protein
MEKNEVEQRPIPMMGWIVRRLWFAHLVKDGGIVGLDYLQNAVTQSRTQNKKIRFTPAHLADADHPVALHEMKQNGRGMGIQEEIVWVMANIANIDPSYV